MRAGVELQQLWSDSTDWSFIMNHVITWPHKHDQVTWWPLTSVTWISPSLTKIVTFYMKNGLMVMLDHCWSFYFQIIFQLLTRLIIWSTKHQETKTNNQHRNAEGHGCWCQFDLHWYYKSQRKNSRCDFTRGILDTWNQTCDFSVTEQCVSVGGQSVTITLCEAVSLSSRTFPAQQPQCWVILLTASSKPPAAIFLFQTESCSADLAGAASCGHRGRCSGVFSFTLVSQ